MRVDEKNVGDWLSEIRQSKIALPRFQRFEEWQRKIKENFLTSVVRELPTGALLVLEKNTPPFEYRYLKEAPEDDVGPDKLLLDGQQRLTTLWKSLNDYDEERTFLLDLSDDQPKVVSEKRRKKRGKIYPLWVDKPEGCWDRKKVPLYLLNPDDSPRHMREWSKEAVDDEEERDELLDTFHEVRDTISTFKLPSLVLEEGTDPDNAIDVFIKLNTSYVELSTFDIVVARTEAQTGDSLHDKKEELLERCPEIKDYKDPEKYVLNVVALLQEKRPTQTNQKKKLDFQQMIDEWGKVVSGTEQLIDFLEQEKIFDKKRIPTNVILAPLAALLTHVSTHPDERGNEKRILKRYMWRAFFTDRYETSTNEGIYQDYNALKKVLNGQETEVPCFDEEKHPLPTKNRLMQANWPKKKNRLGRAILSLTIKKGAKNFADDDVVTKRNIENREYHHLYPRDYLEKNGFEEEEIDKALNCALIRWEDNRTISGKEPLEYLVERSKADDLGEEQIKKRLRTHLVDYKTIIENDYERFLEDRASRIENELKEVCEGRDI